VDWHWHQLHSKADYRAVNDLLDQELRSNVLENQNQEYENVESDTESLSSNIETYTDSETYTKQFHR
jgi:hypothetical protein